MYFMLHKDLENKRFCLTKAERTTRPTSHFHAAMETMSCHAMPWKRPNKLCRTDMARATATLPQGLDGLMSSYIPGFP